MYICVYVCMHTQMYGCINSNIYRPQATAFLYYVYNAIKHYKILEKHVNISQSKENI